MQKHSLLTAGFNHLTVYQIDDLQIWKVKCVKPTQEISVFDSFAWTLHLHLADIKSMKKDYISNIHDWAVYKVYIHKKLTIKCKTDLYSRFRPNPKMGM